MASCKSWWVSIQVAFPVLFGFLQKMYTIPVKDVYDSICAIYKASCKYQWVSISDAFPILFGFLQKMCKIPVKKCIQFSMGDCERPCFNQLNEHILDRLWFCWLFFMCTCSWSKMASYNHPLTSLFQKCLPPKSKSDEIWWYMFHD